MRQFPDFALFIVILVFITIAGLLAHVDYRVGVLGAWVLAFITISIILKPAVPSQDRLWLLIAWTSRLIVVFALGLWVENYYRVRTGLDAVTYHKLGKEIANLFRMGIFPTLTSDQRWSGTFHYALQTGFFYWIFYPSAQLMKVINTFVAFLGTLGFYRVYRRMKPFGAVDLPLFFLLLMPSTLYWTSIHGKDPWMYAFLGMATFFVMRFLEHFRPWDFMGFVIGVLGMIWIRPHIAVIFTLSIAVMAFIRRYKVGVLSPVVRLFIIIPILVAVYLAIRFVRESFGVSTPEEMLAFAVYHGKVSAYGGSAIRLPNVQSFIKLLAYYPFGFITVLFRPFLWETRSLFGVISALENLVLLVFSVAYLRRHRWIPKHSIGQMAGVYVLLFVLAFYPASGNLGTLVRQKVQVLPFWFLYLGSLPDKKRRTVTNHVNTQITPLSTRKFIHP